MLVPFNFVLHQTFYCRCKKGNSFSFSDTVFVYCIFIADYTAYFLLTYKFQHERHKAEIEIVLRISESEDVKCILFEGKSGYAASSGMLKWICMSIGKPGSGSI